MHAYCTALVYLCVFARWGFLGADLSKFCCVSSSVGDMNIHEVLLSLVKASCCCTGACRRGGQWGCRLRVHRWGESMFHSRLTSWRLGDLGEVVSLKTVQEAFTLCIQALPLSSLQWEDMDNDVFYISPVTWCILHVHVWVIISALHFKKPTHHLLKSSPRALSLWISK